MIISFRYYATANQALASIAQSENQKSCEVIFAQRVTNKADLDFGHDARPELPVSLIDFHFKFRGDNNMVVFNISEEADLFLYQWLASMSAQGITFDQFVCFRNDMKDDTIEFHILCGLINHYRSLQHVANVNYCAYDAMIDIYAELGIEKPDLQVIGEDFIFDVNAKSKFDSNLLVSEEPQETTMLYGDENPLTHELVVPYIAEIHENLTQKLVG